eukprot:tig00000940_g5558.t1
MRFRDRCILAWFGPRGLRRHGLLPLLHFPPEEYAGEGWYRGEPWRFAGPPDGEVGEAGPAVRRTVAFVAAALGVLGWQPPDVVEWLVRRFGLAGRPLESAARRVLGRLWLTGRALLLLPAGALRAPLLEKLREEGAGAGAALGTRWGAPREPRPRGPPPPPPPPRPPGPAAGP